VIFFSSRWTYAVLSLSLLALVCIAGCGPAGPQLVKVTGMLTVNGSPYDANVHERAIVILYPSENPGTTYPAIVDDNGAFKVPGIEGNGVPPGKYKISVEPESDTRKTPLAVKAGLKGPQSTLEKDIAAGAGDLGKVEIAQGM
jgi:hypothetical protein